MELTKLTISEISEGLASKKFSAREITDAHLKAIAERDGQIGAYLSVSETSAREQADEVDRALQAGEKLDPLAGVPLAIKDAILVKGHPATGASKMLESYIAPYDADAIKNLRAKGAVFLGKVNMDEFAMGGSTENSAFKITRNPRDTERVPGGSSGGSAAAVAADMAVASLGSDTGGSIRQPAGFCDVVGLKPTYGSVSRSGLMAMASSLDVIGPFTKTVKDAAFVFDAIRGTQKLDSTTQYPPISSKDLTAPDLTRIADLTVGLPEEYFGEGIEPYVAKKIESAIDRLKGLGVKFKKVSLPHTKYALSCYYIIMPAEVSSNLARLDGIRYARIASAHKEDSTLTDIYLNQRGAGFGPEVKRRIILGTFVLSSGYYDAYYSKAQKVRALIRRDFENAFKEVDILLTPTSPTVPFRFGEKMDDPLSMYLADIFTLSANLAGIPGLSMPADVPGKDLPVGVQLLGKHHREADILGMGMLYERDLR